MSFKDHIWFGGRPIFCPECREVIHRSKLPTDLDEFIALAPGVSSWVYECPRCLLELVFYESSRSGRRWRFCDELVNLIDNDRLVLPESVIACMEEINAEFLQYLSKNPRRIHATTPRQFEIVVAELLKSSGFEVEVTPPSKDGGIDILAASKSEVGTFLTIVECKKYSEVRPVPIGVIRAAYGLKQHHKASNALVVTTSRFTKVAHDFQQTHKYELTLKDYRDIEEWLHRWNQVSP